MIKAVIFDMDGVISDTQKFHSQTESKILKKYGINLTPKEISFKYAGVPERVFFKDLLAEKGLKVNSEDLVKEKWELFMKEVKIDPILGVIDLINSLSETNLKLGVASSSPHHFINLVLNTLGIKSKFSAIASGTEVVNGKPNPDIFLLAARKLNVPPAECLVIEDGISGMIGSKKAGMRCIGFVENKDYKTYPADVLVTDLTDIKIEDIIDM